MLWQTALLALIKIALIVGGIMTAAAYLVLLERWIAAWVQDRRGPNRVGAPFSVFIPWMKDWKLFGLGQPAADGLKMIFKEEYTPAHVDKRLFILAPVVILAAALAIFAAIPLGDRIPPIPSLGLDEPIALLVAPQIDVGLLYVFALSSIAVYGVILGGWASNSKFSFLGALRSSAQLISYEIPLGLGILGVVLAAGSLRLDVIINAQAETGFWFALVQPLGFIVFVISAFAESARLPFDLPECEQELVGGYHAEYSGIKLLLFLVAEFLHMITAAFLIVILFLGGWHLWGLTGGPDEPLTWTTAILRHVVLMSKVLLVILFFMLVRWTWPRFRFDQLMTLAWKIILPLGLVNLLSLAILYEAMEANWFGGVLSMKSGPWLVCAIGWFVAIVAWMGVAWISPLVTDNRPRMRTRRFGIDPQI